MATGNCFCGFCFGDRSLQLFGAVQLVKICALPKIGSVVLSQTFQDCWLGAILMSDTLTPVAAKRTFDFTDQLQTLIMSAWVIQQRQGLWALRTRASRLFLGMSR